MAVAFVDLAEAVHIDRQKGQLDRAISTQHQDENNREAYEVHEHREEHEL